MQPFFSFFIFLSALVKYSATSSSNSLFFFLSLFLFNFFFKVFFKKKKEKIIPSPLFLVLFRLLCILNFRTVLYGEAGVVLSNQLLSYALCKLVDITIT